MADKGKTPLTPFSMKKLSISESNLYERKGKHVSFEGNEQRCVRFMF